jgi:hypothetical protein
MAEHDSLRPPFADLSDCLRRLSSLDEERQAHAEEYLAVGMIHPGELGGRSPWLGNLVQFDVDDCVGKYQSPRSFVEEYEFFEIASGEKQLVDLPTPFLGRNGVEISRKVDIHLPCPCPLPHTW